MKLASVLVTLSNPLEIQQVIYYIDTFLEIYIYILHSFFFLLWKLMVLVDKFYTRLLILHWRKVKLVQAVQRNNTTHTWFCSTHSVMNDCSCKTDGQKLAMSVYTNRQQSSSYMHFVYIQFVLQHRNPQQTRNEHLLPLRANPPTKQHSIRGKIFPLIPIEKYPKYWLSVHKERV